MKLISIEMEEENNTSGAEICGDCHGTGIIKEKDGTNHTCWKCLSEGKLEQHTTNIKDYGIRI